MPVQYCKIVENSCYLNTEFGMNLAMKWFGLDETALEAIVGRNSKGKRQGQLKGSIAWAKTIVGGWYKAQGRVSLPGEIHNPRIVDSYTGKTIWEKGTVRQQELEAIAIDAIKAERQQQLEVAKTGVATLKPFIDTPEFLAMAEIHQKTMRKLLKEYEDKIAAIE